MEIHIIKNKKRILVVLGILLCSSLNAQVVQKTINTTVGSSFYLYPWADRPSVFSGYTCASTFCNAEDVSAFSINVSTTTTTKYPSYNDLYEKGFYSSYRATALKVGAYNITGGGTCYKKEGYRPSNLYIGDPRVIYHVIVTEKPIVTSISIPSSLTLTVGDDYTFSPIITESGASTTLSWNSSNTRVVSVTNSGGIKALTSGSSIITCTASNGVYAQCVVTVNPILVSSVSLNYQEFELEEGKRFILEATILPANSTNKEISWSSSNDNVAFVGTNGLVIGVSPGYCNITATTKDGSNKNASCIVHVYKLNLAESISFKNSSVEIIQRESIILEPEIYPTNVSNRVLTWTSSNPSCASVNNDGVVNGVNKGTAIITASTTDGSNLSASCDIIIKSNKFEIVYLIDGEVYKKDSCLYGKKIILPEVPIKEGYTFGGWSNVPDFMAATDLIITGSYEVNYYLLTYMVDGDIYKTVNIAFGSFINSIEDPQKTGFEFQAWNNLPETMPAHDVTVEAIFDTTTGIDNIKSEKKHIVYSLTGIKLTELINIEDMKRILPNGSYIIDGRKIFIRK